MQIGTHIKKHYYDFYKKRKTIESAKRGNSDMYSRVGERGVGKMGQIICAPVPAENKSIKIKLSSVR